MASSLKLSALGALAVLLLEGCGDEPAAAAAWRAMCEAYCTHGVECLPEVSLSECRSLCLDEFKGIPCEADPAILDECVAAIESLSCQGFPESELPRVCNHMCTGGLCEGVDCDDGIECTDDICNPVDGSCDSEPLPDGTPCSGGGCEDLVCTSTFSCTEDGLLTAIQAGGGPYTFACDGPTTIETSDRIVVDNNVILNGEGNLTLDGRGLHPVISVFGPPTGITVELIGFVITGSAESGTAISSGQARLTVSDCIVRGNAGGGIGGRGTLTVNNSTLTENGGGISGHGMLSVNNSVIADNDGTGIISHGASVVSDTTVSGNSGHSGGGVSCMEGEMTVSNVAVTGNTAFESGGIHVSRDCTVTLNESTVSENSVESQSGGGISIEYGGALIVNNSTVSNNTAADSGGVHCSGGSRLTMVNSTVSGNNATFANGGGISVDGMATITNSTISDNAADNGGGISGGNGELVLKNVAVWGNTARQNGGGIYSEHGTLSLTNCTVSENSAVETGGGIHNRSELTVVASTVSSNDADTASAIYFATGTMILAGSIIDGDCYAEDHPNNISSAGDNIESPGDTCGLDGSNDQLNVTSIELNLGPLQDNGGPTLTQAPEPPSEAIDAVQNCVDAQSQPLATDQRGVSRPQGPQCDVGAVEVAAEP